MTASSHIVAARPTARRRGGRFAAEHLSEDTGLLLDRSACTTASAAYAESLSRALNRTVSGDTDDRWMGQAAMTREITVFLDGACGPEDVDAEALARQTWITMNVDTGLSSKRADLDWDQAHEVDPMMIRTRRAVGRALERVPAPILGAPASTGIVDALPWPVPDLSAEQQRATGLPADFAEAFDRHFAQAAEVLDRHVGRTEDAVSELTLKRDDALTRLAKRFRVSETIRTGLPASPGAHDPRASWVLDDGDAGLITITYFSWRDSQWDGGHWAEGPSLSSKRKAAATHAGDAWRAEQAAQRVEMLSDIRAGLVAPWNFLPSTRRQENSARNVIGAIGRETRQIEARDRVRRETTWALKYAGMSEQQIADEFLDQYAEAEVTDRWTGELKKAWLPRGKSPYQFPPTTREYLEDRARRYAARYTQAVQERSTLSHTAKEDQARRAELEDQARYYRQSAGWPAGDLSPLQRRDGSWAFLLQSGHGAREWGREAVPAR